MSLLFNYYLMNKEKPKIKNQNKKNKYIPSKPSFLITSNTLRYFEEKVTKKISNNTTFSPDHLNNSIKEKNNYMNSTDHILTLNSSRSNFIFSNDENKENSKNKYNMINSNINDIKNIKKINILNQKKKKRTLSSNINKIIKDINKDKNNILKLPVPSYHKKSNSISLNDNILFKNLKFHKNKNNNNNNSFINSNNNSRFNNTINNFYNHLKQIIPNDNKENIENNNNKNEIQNYANKNKNLNKNIDLIIKKKTINKSFTSSNFIKFQKKIPKSYIIPKPKIIKKILKIDSCTIPGYTINGIKQKNLDSFFLKKNFLNKEENFLIGICDGHGLYGDLISKYISSNLYTYIKNISSQNIIQAFEETNKALITKTKLDCSLSGSTCTSLIISLEKIISANIGTTRAILARYENGYYNVINLTRDHKLNELDEIKRVINKGGIIQKYFDKKTQEFIGQEKIWMKNSDIPGLNMTRSFGDNLAHSIGVINIPSISEYEFTGNEKFIVIATESIWQYIDSDECARIVKDFYENNRDAIGALNELVSEAIKRWKKEENKIEDITAVVIFFE